MLFDPTNWILVITIFLWCIAFIDSISEKKFPSQCVDEYRVQFRGTSYCKIHHRLEKYRKRELAISLLEGARNRPVLFEIMILLPASSLIMWISFRMVFSETEKIYPKSLAFMDVFFTR